MTQAFKCDRCGGFSEGDGLGVTWDEPGKYTGGDKELCNSCIYGLVEYICGEDAERLNEWDHIGIENNE